MLDIAPNLELLNSAMQPVTLQACWQAQPIILTFLRHFGCAFCRDHLIGLRDNYAAIKAAGAEVIGIAQGDPIQTGMFAQRYRLPYPLLADPDRASYRAYGLLEGTLKDALGPALFLRKPIFLATELIKQEPVVGEIRQLGGVFVIDQKGQIQYAHQAQPIYQYPTLEHLLDIIRSLPTLTP